MQNTRNTKPEMLRVQHFTKKVKKIFNLNNQVVFCCLIYYYN